MELTQGGDSACCGEPHRTREHVNLGKKAFVLGLLELMARLCASAGEPNTNSSTKVSKATNPPAAAIQASSLLPAGLDYVWWRFGVAEFEDFQIDITIHNDLGTEPGIYFKMYQGQIGEVGFYFGLQTDVYEPNRGGRGKGLIFSRWKTRDLADVRPASDGWAQSAGYEGDFVGIRKKYEWTNHSYRLRLT